MTEALASLLKQLTPEEQAEVETFAAFVIVRRNLRHPQLLSDDISPQELARLVMAGGSFDWLAQEEDIYALEDGDNVVWPGEQITRGRDMLRS